MVLLLTEFKLYEKVSNFIECTTTLLFQTFRKDIINGILLEYYCCTYPKAKLQPKWLVMQHQRSLTKSAFRVVEVLHHHLVEESHILLSVEVNCWSG